MESATPPEHQSSAFVLIPFEEEYDAVHAKLIVPALEDVGYAVERADSVIDQRSVLSDIVLGIDGADLIVADLTGLNPNVFYELGIAHGLGVPTVLITQSIEELPFDLRTYRVMEYSTRFDESEALMEFLREVGREAADGGVKFGSPVSDFLPASPAKQRLLEASRGGRVARPSTEQASQDGGSTKEPEGEDEGEPGTLDLLNSYIGSQERSMEILAVIGDETTDVGSKLAKHTQRMEEAVASTQPGSVARAHRVATEVADDMDAYGAVLRTEVPHLEDACEEMIESGIEWLTRTGAEQDEGDVEDFRVAAAGLYLATAETKEFMRDYRRTILSTKGVTRPLDKAADRVSSSLERIVNTIEKTQSFASRATDIAQEILDAGELCLVMEPTVECFANPEGTKPQPFDAILLAKFDRGADELALPFRGESLEKHAIVSFELQADEEFPESWYRHPSTGAIEHAWTQATLFIGAQIGEPTGDGGADALRADVEHHLDEADGGADERSKD